MFADYICAVDSSARLPSRAPNWARPLLLSFVPLLLLICGYRSLPEGDVKTTGQQQVYPVQKFRTVVLLLDSLGTPMAFDPGLMPFVSSLMGSSLFGEARACPMKATFPCVKSIFEGRVATTGTSLQDFSAVASKGTAWPDSLAKLGQRVVVASDHTLNRLYPADFVDSLNYENLTVPLFERDDYAYRQTEKWMADPNIDVLILHIIGTDKVAHQYPVRGPEYREKYLEVDNFARSVAERLSPNDYIYIVGDHGHNNTGGHTEDAAYIAHGPLFPQGKNQDLDSSDMLFLLSIPYGLTLPADYEGKVRTDLTLLPDDLREQWLRAQAKAWGVQSADVSTNSLEARLNGHVITNREMEHHLDAVERAYRLAPWILAGALFLISQLKISNGSTTSYRLLQLFASTLFIVGIVLGIAGVAFGGVLASLGAFLFCVRRLGAPLAFTGFNLLCALMVLEFWLLPSRAAWFHNMRNQPLGWLLFYPLAALAGVVLSLASETRNLRQRIAQIVWTVGVAIWLLTYFGPYKYALTGRGPIIVLLILTPLAILVTDWRKLISLPTLCGVGVLPFIVFHTESHNINYILLDLISAWPRAVNLAICAIAGLAWIVAFQLARRRPLKWSWAILIMAIWGALGIVLFQFEPGKLIGALLGGVWLAGCLELFRRAGLATSWSALVSAIMLFAVCYFSLDGFTLSHVDFRFASEKIIPFQQEIYRAPQLIAWAMLKYFFILLPVFAVLFVITGRNEVARYVAQLGWWRELMLVICTLGLSLFDKGGLTELCGEEIYFWTFLNIGIGLFAMIIAWSNSNAEGANAFENGAGAGTYPAEVRTSPPPPA